MKTKVIITKCPKEIVDISIDAVYTRACWELGEIEPIIEMLEDELENYAMEYVDRNIVDNDYVTEYTIKPFVIGLPKLKDVLKTLRTMATPPDLSGC